MEEEGEEEEELKKEEEEGELKKEEEEEEGEEVDRPHHPDVDRRVGRHRFGKRVAEGGSLRNQHRLQLLIESRECSFPTGTLVQILQL